MHGQRIGYIRVSTLDQNPDRQLEGAQVSKVFTDKASGKDTRRPQLDALLGYIREGDTARCRVRAETVKRLAARLGITFPRHEEQRLSLGGALVARDDSQCCPESSTYGVIPTI
jgi:predicted site-specific integrase-resolvase